MEKNHINSTNKTNINKNNTSSRNIIFFGIGAVGSCCVNYFSDFFNSFEFKDIVMVDKNNNVTNVPCVSKAIKKGAKFILLEITRDNLCDTLDTMIRVKAGDILIDLTTQTKASYFLQCCINRKMHYTNSALNEDFGLVSSTFSQHMHILELNKLNNNCLTCVVETGMNPGLISTFAKKGIKHIVKKCISEHINNIHDSHNLKKTNIYNDLVKAFQENDYALMGKILGLKMIICSENDTQIAQNPPNVPFYNTWSAVGLIEEYLEPLEISVGTHEKSIPFENNDALTFVSPTILTSSHIISGNTLIESVYVDEIVGKEIKFSTGYGRCINHGECISLSRFFTGHSYAPTVYFSYKINPATDKVLNTTSNKDLNDMLKPAHTLVTLDQTHDVNGYDNVGALLVFDNNPFTNTDTSDNSNIFCWWCGSIMSNEYVQNELHDNYFLPTTIQVIAGVLSSLSYALENPNEGILFCEALDDKFIINKTKKYLGVLYNGPTNIQMSSVYLNEVIHNSCKTGSTSLHLI
jgi:homospermidine synthase